MSQSPRRRKLLLLEDDPQLGPLVAEVLAETYDVTIATDGAEALTLALDGTFDALVLDRRVPTMDGIEVIRQLRTHHVSTPALLLSAYGTSSDAYLGIRAGADDYLTKPFQIDELLARLRMLTLN